MLEPSGRMAREFRRSVAATVEVEPTAPDRYIVHVPMTFSDGDHYVVVLRDAGGRWRLTDEGHTLMHLSYELRNPESGRAGQIIDSIVQKLGLSRRNGALELDLRSDRYGDTLFTYLQAITQVSDVSYLHRNRATSTFQNDFRETIREAVPFADMTFIYSHPERDPDANYPVDVMLQGESDRQIVLFGIASEYKCQKATITLHQWREWGEKLWRIAVFDGETRISQKARERLLDVADKQYADLESARRNIGRDVRGLVGETS